MVFAANTVSYAAGNPVASKGSVSAQGPYTIDEGYTTTGSNRVLVPTAGGTGLSGVGTVNLVTFRHCNGACGAVHRHLLCDLSDPSLALCSYAANAQVSSGDPSQNRTFADGTSNTIGFAEVTLSAASLFM